MDCCICGIEIENDQGWTEGHNAEPVRDGRCCGACNYSVVIPMRLRQQFPTMNTEHTSEIVGKIAEVESG